MDLEQVPSSEFESSGGGKAQQMGNFAWDPRFRRVLTASCELGDALCGGHSFTSSRRAQSYSAVAPAHIQISRKISHSKTYHRSIILVSNRSSNSKLITRRLHQCNLFGLKTRNSRRPITRRVMMCPVFTVWIIKLILPELPNCNSIACRRQ
jgi:hypothetical protein